MLETTRDTRQNSRVGRLYLLFDECVGRSLQVTAEALGHVVQRSSEVFTLGFGASDQAIFDFARRAGAVVVTVNRGDFITLAAGGREHPGVILVPSLPLARLRPLFSAILAVAPPLFEPHDNLFVEIDGAGTITSFRLP